MRFRIVSFQGCGNPFGRDEFETNDPTAEFQRRGYSVGGAMDASRPPIEFIGLPIVIGLRGPLYDSSPGGDLIARYEDRAVTHALAR